MRRFSLFLFNQKMLFLFLCIVALGLLAACGGGSVAEETPAADEASTESADVEEADAETLTGDEELKKLVIAEPVHLIGYLPLYVAIHEGYFAENGLDVEVITATGGAHVTAVVGGNAWGVIGGPESNAMANEGSSDPIVGLVNVVNRANVYLMAKSGLAPEGDSDEELANFLEGKTIAAGRHGGSPNLLTRWLLIEMGLDPEEDVRLEEPADAAAVVSMVQQGAAEIANGAEPQVSEGIWNDVWDEPFYGFPQLGDYPYSVIGVKRSAIEEEQEVVKDFVEAMLKALTVVQEDEELAKEVLKTEFPTLSDAAIRASLDRAYADNLWSEDGFVTEESLDLTMDVVNKTGVFTEDYSYDELIDMQFVE